MALVHQSFALNLKILRFFGFYPTSKNKLVYKLYSYVMYLLFIIPPPILTALNLLLGENVDLAVVAQNAFAVFETGCFIFKLFPFISRSRGIKNCVYLMEDPMFIANDKNIQEEIVKEYIGVCTRNSHFFMFFVALTTFSWAIVPMFGHEYKLPLDVWLPYDIQSGGIYYILSYIFIVMGVTTSAMSNSAIDPLIGGLAYFATAQVKILKYNLEHIYEQAKEEASNQNMQNNLKEITYSRIKHCIKHHTRISKFVQVYAKTFTPLVFIQFSASVLVICISCLQLTIVEPFTASFFSMVIFINAVLMEIFFYCYYGTTLFEESNTLVTAAYMGEWLEYDIKSRKALIILMERCKRPITVTAGNILDLSLITFTTILRRAYSLLAVFKNY